ncbi:MAG TPA: alpha/beta hydrolase [bacterium]|nr:alpha/beta hydrolase [bacterium]
MSSQRVQFTNQTGASLAGYLDVPGDTPARAYALFAHCFTCGKNLKPIKNINTTLAGHGIATLRFDFTGIGESEGDFSESNFSTNIEDLVAAADYLDAEYSAPGLLIGHSMGGAAILQAARLIDSIRAVVTIAAPSGPEHLSHILREKRDLAMEEGTAEVTIGGRTFTLRRQFFHDLEKQHMAEVIRNLRKPLLVLHSPEDQTVAIENAYEIFEPAQQPKSLISLDQMGHLMLEEEDARYVGDLIAAWAGRYL